MVIPAKPETPPPGLGLNTLTANVPTEAISMACTCAVKFVESTNVVGRSLPLTRTTEPFTKSVPVSESTKAGSPALTVVGEILLKTGNGFCIARLNEFETPPPGNGFSTVMGTRPAFATSTAVRSAVTLVVLTKVVDRALPLNLTVEPLTKLVPSTVRVNAAAPAETLAGLILVTVGVALFTIRSSELETPPPGNGLETVTARVPAT
jgi:hypothetical protein